MREFAEALVVMVDLILLLPWWAQVCLLATLLVSAAVLTAVCQLAAWAVRRGWLAVRRRRARRTTTTAAAEDAAPRTGPDRAAR